jgi:hypothetical protein
MKLVVFCLASCVLRGSCGTWSLSVANVALCLARGCAQKEYQLTQKKIIIPELIRPPFFLQHAFLPRQSSGGPPNEF